MTLFDQEEYQLVEEVSEPEASEPEAGQRLLSLAEQLGEAPSAFIKRGDITEVLERMQEGVIVTLHITGPRRFYKKLTPQDLGLALDEKGGGVLSEEASKVLTSYFHLGSLNLLPKKTQDRLSAIERRARFCLERYSLKSHWGAFIPVTAYSRWKEDNAECEQEFWVIRDELVNDYDRITKEVLEAYRTYAEDAWRMAVLGRTMIHEQRSPTADLLASLVTKLTGGAGKEAFVARYLGYIRKAFKSKEEIARSFTYVIERSFIPLPSLLARDLEQAERIYGERKLRDARVQAELEAVEAQRRVEQQRLHAEEYRERDLRSVQLQAERDRLRQQQEMERDVLEEAQRDKERLIRQFYADVVGEINNHLQYICENVLENIEEHQGQLRGAISQQLRRLIEQVEMLNFMGNEQIETHLAHLRAVVPTHEESTAAARGAAKIDTTRMRQVLRLVQEETKGVVIELGLTPISRKKRGEEAALSEPSLIDLSRRKARPSDILADREADAGTGRRKKRAKSTATTI